VRHAPLPTLLLLIPLSAQAAEPASTASASGPVGTVAQVDEPGTYGTAKGLVGMPRFEAFVLKSGTWIYVQVPTERAPATVSWLRDAPGWDAVVRTCPLADARSWMGIAGFFGAVAAEQVPTSHELEGTDGHTACVLTAAWGVTDETSNVVNLNVAPASGPSFHTTLSRREAEALAARLAALAQEVSRLPVPTPAAEPEPEGPSESELAEVAVVSARTLYVLKGWRRAGDPGWEADVQAVRRAMELGWLPSDVVARGMEDRRMRPGALADVLGIGE